MLALFGQDVALPFNLDAWDGYPAERERLYDLIRQSGARTVVVSGDSHTAWANQLHDDQGTQVAVEMGVTSITSPTRWLDAWLPDLQLAKTLAEQNPEIVAADDGHNGFVRLTLSFDKMVGEWMAVDTILSQTYTCTAKARFTAPALPGKVGALTIA
jgi:alkaline phosphatase D